MLIPERIIALETRSSKFGFAVLERPGRLLDWGVRTFGEDIEKLESILSDRLNTLLTFYSPTVVVMRPWKHISAANDEKSRKAFRAVRLIVNSRKTTFQVLTTKQVRNRLDLNSDSTKHDVAKNLAERFEELAFKLPNKRKAYQSEAPAMLVFDALATGVAFLEKPVL